MNFQALKQQADQINKAMVRAGFRNPSRAACRAAIIEAIQVVENPAERRFIGCYIMSCYGYGGGL